MTPHAVSLMYLCKSIVLNFHPLQSCNITHCIFCQSRSSNRYKKKIYIYAQAITVIEVHVAMAINISHKKKNSGITFIFKDIHVYLVYIYELVLHMPHDEGTCKRFQPW